MGESDKLTSHYSTGGIGHYRGTHIGDWEPRDGNPIQREVRYMISDKAENQGQGYSKLRNIG